jgi:hypothetical protein
MAQIDLCMVHRFRGRSSYSADKQSSLAIITGEPIPKLILFLSKDNTFWIKRVLRLRGVMISFFGGVRALFYREGIIRRAWKTFERVGLRLCTEKSRRSAISKSYL